MPTERNRAKGLEQESAILVGVLLPEPRGSFEQRGPGEAPLEELHGLAETAGVAVCGELLQRREIPDQATYLGSGKVEELRLQVEAQDADVVIFDNDLSPAQIRNLERAINSKVLDRTELILDIFATRAQTYEARLAVELAQLQYALPRLKRMWTHLSRIKAGVGMRGPGEKQLEVDRRLVENRIHELETELADIHRRRSREVKARSDRMTVSLVGYTNAGKSTLLNTLTAANVLAEDKLFATLDTRTRRWQLPGWGPVLLSDTVGFVRDLPHHLVASFRATLEEARQANLLLHVADAANPAVLSQIAAVYKVLEELQIEAKDTLLVLNKVDRVADPHLLERVLARFPLAIPISAKSGQGLDDLAAAVSRELSREFQSLEIVAPVSDGKLLAFLATHGEILSREYAEEQVVIHCRIPARFTGKLLHEGYSIKEFNPVDEHAVALPGSSSATDASVPPSAAAAEPAAWLPLAPPSAARPDAMEDVA